MVPKEQSWELGQESIQFLSESDAPSTMRSLNPNFNLGRALLNHLNCGIQQKLGTLSTDGRATGIHTDRVDLRKGRVFSRSRHSTTATLGKDGVLPYGYLIIWAYPCPMGPNQHLITIP